MKIVPVKIPHKKASVPMSVDDEHFLTFSAFKWYLMPNGYAKTGGYRNTYAHHIILKSSHKKMEVDHIDRNKLNNQKSNLRLVTKTQNQGNRGLNINNTSGYKGVRWRKDRHCYSVKIFNKGKSIHLGHFAKKEEAVEAYDTAAKEYFGRYALLNSELGY